MVVQSVSNLNDLKNDASGDVSVVHFYADWSDECKHIDKILETLSSLPEFANITFKKCAAEGLPDVSKQYSVTAVPTILFLEKGNKVDELTGADPALLKSKLQQFIKKPVVDDAVSSFINSDIVVAFIEGDEKTESSSSKELLNLLGTCGSKYTNYDVSADISIKQRVQTVSGSSSFPQLFIKGSFVGDLTTAKKLNSTGELQAMIEAANKNLNKSLVLRLRSLINKTNIVVFMKGDREAPRCGFSRQLMEILKETGLPFETFDILSDESVRQGLKVYSDWPTYPQVYVKGELVGGLDIIKSLVDDGELVPTLKGEV